MGFMDRVYDLKDRLLGEGDDEYYDEEYVDDDVDDGYEDGEPGGYEEDSRSRMRSTNLTDSRGSTRGAGVLGNSVRPEAETVSVFTRSGARVGSDPSPSTGGYTSPSSFAQDSFREGTSPSSVPMSSLLPPTILRPQSYNDIQSIVRRVRTPQVVVLDLRSTAMDVARRILDFSFGLACGVDGEVKELDDRVFCVLPHGAHLTSADRERLSRERIIH